MWFPINTMLHYPFKAGPMYQFLYLFEGFLFFACALYIMLYFLYNGIRGFVKFLIISVILFVAFLFVMEFVLRAGWEYCIYL